MSLELAQIRQIARLARLELTEPQSAAMAEQLNRILGYVDSLQEVDTEGIEPLAHPLPISNVFRADEPHESLPVAEALANAPKRAGNYFAVPAVFDAADEMTA